MREWTDALAESALATDGADQIDEIRALEEVVCAAQARQTRLAAAFNETERARQQAAGVPTAQQGRGIAEQIALARRESPHRGRQHLSLAKVAHELPARDGGVPPWPGHRVAGHHPGPRDRMPVPGGPAHRGPRDRRRPRGLRGVLRAHRARRGPQARRPPRPGRRRPAPPPGGGRAPRHHPARTRHHGLPHRALPVAQGVAVYAALLRRGRPAPRRRRPALPFPGHGRHPRRPGHRLGRRRRPPGRPRLRRVGDDRPCPAHRRPRRRRDRRPRPDPRRPGPSLVLRNIDTGTQHLAAPPLPPPRVRSARRDGLPPAPIPPTCSPPSCATATSGAAPPGAAPPSGTATTRSPSPRAARPMSTPDRASASPATTPNRRPAGTTSPAPAPTATPSRSPHPPGIAIGPPHHRCSAPDNPPTNRSSPDAGCSSPDLGEDLRWCPRLGTGVGGRRLPTRRAPVTHVAARPRATPVKTSTT